MSYEAERAALEEIFPRGRFHRTSNGACIIVGPRRSASHIMMWELGTARDLGLFTTKDAENGFRKRLGALILRDLNHLLSQREALLILQWSPEVGERLPEFSYAGGTPEDALSASGRAAAEEVAHE